MNRSCHAPCEGRAFLLSNLHSLSPLGHFDGAPAPFTTYCRACSRFCAWKPTHHFAGEYELTQQPAHGACAVCVAATSCQGSSSVRVWMLAFGVYKVQSAEFEASCSHECTNSYKGLIPDTETLGANNRGRSRAPRGPARGRGRFARRGAAPRPAVSSPRAPGRPRTTHDPRRDRGAVEGRGPLEGGRRAL